MNKIQVAVIWASLSILLVAGYLTYKEVSLRDFQISQDSSFSLRNGNPRIIMGLTKHKPK